MPVWLVARWRRCAGCRSPYRITWDVACVEACLCAVFPIMRNKTRDTALSKHRGKQQLTTCSCIQHGNWSAFAVESIDCLNHSEAVVVDAGKWPWILSRWHFNPSSLETMKYYLSTHSSLRRTLAQFCFWITRRHSLPVSCRHASFAHKMTLNNGSVNQTFIWNFPFIATSRKLRSHSCAFTRKISGVCSSCVTLHLK